MTGGARPGANRAFADDAIISLMLLNRVRRHVVSDMFGLSGLTRGESALITLSALGALASAFEAVIPTIPRPSTFDLLAGTAMIREGGYRIVGSSASAVPGFVGLVALSVIWRYHPLARGTARLARESARWAEASERWIRTIYGPNPAA
jgi:hypothetical protein